MTASGETGPLPLMQATCVLIGAAAVLIRGAPGSGKSALAAALIARRGPGRLVRLLADDAVRLAARGGRLVAFAPEPIRGLIEMRGLGLVAVDHEPRAVVRLLVDLVTPAEVERLPEASATGIRIAGVEIARIVLPAGDPASPDRVLEALAKAVSAIPRPGGESAAVPPAGRIRA